MSDWTDRVRKSFSEADDIRDAGLSTPPDVFRQDDILYGKDPVWQRLDVYRPRNSEGPLPVIVSVHGGGWAYGDKERYQWYCMDLARRGFGSGVLPSPGIRLFPLRVPASLSTAEK